ncbi:MAG: MFS transporter [Hyphomicrobiales bacterium]|nr:MFS transporter [Hyphomicrobiales bacterium]
MSQLLRVRFAVLALFTLNGALFGAWAARLPAIQQAFELGARDLGLLLLLPAAGAIVSFPLSGSSCDRYGAARVAGWLAIAFCPAMLLVAWSTNLAMLAVSIALFGAVMGALDVAMNSWGAEVERTGGRPIMSSFHAFFSLGVGLGAASGALAAWAEIGYPVHFTVFALLATGLVWAGRCEWPYAAPDAGSSSFRFVLPKGKLLIVAVVAFAAAMSEGGMLDWSALFITNVLSGSESEGALGITIFSIAMVTMRLLGDRIIMALGPCLTIRICGLSAVAGGSLTFCASSLLIVYPGYFLMGVGYSIVFPLVFSRAANDGQLTQGRAIAAVAFFGYGGILIGSPLIGFLAEEITLRTTFSLFILLALIIFLSAGAFREPDSVNANAGTDGRGEGEGEQFSN